MIPLKDDVPSRSAPIITVLLIALNVLAYFYQASLEFDARGPAAGAAQAFIMEFGLVPCRLAGSCAAPGDFPSPFMTIFTSMFMHGGLFHVGGNMLYLWIFGDNVEDRFGSVKFLLFYLVCGIAATFAQYYVSPGSRIPNVGASGAIAGVLGSYLLLFPNARVRVLLYNQIVAMPAIAVLGFWIVLQIFAGAGALFNTAQSQDTGGVAYMAHVGGFVAGFLFTFLLRGWESDPPRAL